MSIVANASLDELAADPARVDLLPAEAVRSLAIRAAGVLAALQLRSAHGQAAAQSELMDAAAVAAMVGRSRSWVERHVDELPARVSLLGVPCWRRTDLERWLKIMPPYAAEPQERCRA